MKTLYRLLALTGPLALLGGCGPVATPPAASSNAAPSSASVARAPAPALRGGGSSFVNPLMLKWKDVYAKHAGVKIDYQSLGSSKGIEGFTTKTFDFGCTDAPLTVEQLEKSRGTGGEVLHIPLAMGAVVVTYHLPGLKQPLRFSGPALAKIYRGQVKKWNDPVLRELNPGVSLPDREITVVHRSDGSGTTFIWTDYLSKTSPEWKTEVGAGTTVKWPVGVGAKGNEDVAGKVSRTEGAIGYVELTYALVNRLEFGQVQNQAGRFTAPSLETVTAAATAALQQIPDDLRYTLTNAPGKDSYPICGTVWAVLYAEQPAGKAEWLAQFLRWVTTDGQRYARELNYAPLPQELIDRIEHKLRLIRSVN
jgi:phosphate transport system substrate-binding protein